MRYYGFLGVGQRKRLAALREQLSRRVEDIPVADEAFEGEQASDGERRAEVRCPACGQVMRRGAVIQPTVHSPP